VYRRDVVLDFAASARTVDEGAVDADVGEDIIDDSAKVGAFSIEEGAP
jgi:hypothetical protein